MKDAGSFLAKFARLTPPNDAVRRAVAESVSAIAGVPIKREDVSVARNVAFIKCSSVAKSAIRAARVEILEDIVRRMPKARDIVRDVR